MHREYHRPMSLLPPRPPGHYAAESGTDLYPGGDRAVGRPRDAILTGGPQAVHAGTTGGGEMHVLALKMLFGDRAKYLGIIMGLTFASLLITQQGAIFVGLMTRTYGFITDTGLPDLWVMDPKVQFIDDIKPLQDTQLYRVRGTEGVEWAVPLYKGILKARLDNGNFQACNVIGLDDATLIGGPGTMIEGKLEDLRRADAIIVNLAGAKGKLAGRGPDGKSIPLKVGSTVELNDHRAVVVGICQVSRTFQSQPVI